ncbi:MAG: hypothetical protein WCG98_04930 [bacterium]
MDTARKRFEYTIEQELYDILLIDNHFSVYQNQELVRAIDDEELALYDKFILMEVPSDTLYQRVVNDKKERIMETFDIQKIIKHSEYERAVAFDFKHRFNIELLTLENVNLDDTITKIKNFIYEDTNSFKF